MTKQLRFLILLLFIVIGSGVSFTAFASEKTSPEEAAKFIHQLGQSAVQVLGDSSSTLEQREANVQGLLKTNFALDRIGRFVLGKTWKKASQEQQVEYQHLFGQYILAMYARRLGGYTGQTFEVVKAEPVGKKDAVVFTNITRPSATPITCGWRVRRVGTSHKILDVIVEGISMVSAQRAEFSSVVKAQGLDGLINTLRIQVTKFSAQAS